MGSGVETSMSLTRTSSDDTMWILSSELWKNSEYKVKDIFSVLDFGDVMCLMACAQAYAKPVGYYYQDQWFPTIKDPNLPTLTPHQPDCRNNGNI